MPATEPSLRYLDPVVVSRLKHMEMRARLIVEGFITGLHRSPYHGFSVEFAEHRPYNPGDELRHVDWKVYAKTDRHYVKQYEEETNLRNYVVLDTSPSMRYKGDRTLSKLQYAAYLAAGLHALMVRQRDATGLITFSDQIDELIPPKSTPSHLRLLLSTLENLDLTDDAGGARTSAATALGEVTERIQRRSLVVVMTDLFENVSAHADLLRALRHLRHRGHEVLVFHILDHATERKFTFPNVPMVFRDMETGEELSVEPSQLRENYEAAATHFTERFRRECLEHNIDFLEVDTATSYEATLLSYLNRRGKLR